MDKSLENFKQGYNAEMQHDPTLTVPNSVMGIKGQNKARRIKSQPEVKIPPGTPQVQ